MTTADRQTDRQTDDTVTFRLREVVPFHIFYGIPRGDDGKLFRLEAWKIKQQRDIRAELYSTAAAAEPAEPAERQQQYQTRSRASRASRLNEQHPHSRYSRHPGDLEN